MSLNGLTEFEHEVYEFIKRHGEVMTVNIPPKMRGAIPSLVRKGLVEVYKRYTNPFASSGKKKFVRVKE